MFAYACITLINDAQRGYSISMGAEMYFSQVWVIASLVSCVGLIRSFEFSWWLILPGIIPLYLSSLPVRRAIKYIFLGLDYDPPKQQGFKTFEKNIKDKDKS
jgi:hypothetical protein